MTVQDYCKKCNAPYQPAFAVVMRCGLCTVLNGALPPAKYKPIKEVKEQHHDK